MEAREGGKMGGGCPDCMWKAPCGGAAALQRVETSENAAFLPLSFRDSERAS